jgi:hypothetical protein
MQYYLLKATEHDETFATYEEAAKASSDKNLMEQDSSNWQKFLDKLYDTYDPFIPKPNRNYFKSAMSLKELTDSIDHAIETNFKK